MTDNQLNTKENFVCVLADYLYYDKASARIMASLFNNNLVDYIRDKRSTDLTINECKDFLAK